MRKPRITEIFLIQIIFYSIFWFWDDYVATLLSTIFSVICIFILIVSLIAEWIEPSKVPKWYFQVMIASILAPIITGIFFIGIMGLGTEWMDKF
ncbi:MAG: hypothetical protein P1U70_10135 [Saprospiraceae bacterium]|nr:hypothetical protein [Saprospiraceae bacterium]